MGTLYQHGTLANLVPGLFAGTQTLGELLRHGDTGIGTLEGLDGELIILAGTVYQVDAKGVVRIVGPEETVPFANVHVADFETMGLVKADTVTALDSLLQEEMGTANLFVAMQLDGTFEHVTTRAVAKQEPPYPGLGAVADAQSVFESESVTGSLIGYYSPELYAGLASPGWHLHFLSAAHDFGGHVLSYAGVEGELKLQKFSDLHLHLPTDNQAFLNEKLDLSVVGTIKKAEG